MTDPQLYYFPKYLTEVFCKIIWQTSKHYISIWKKMYIICLHTPTHVMKQLVRLQPI